MVFLQQHVALISNPFAQVCPMCHKSFVSSDLLMEHMQIMHKTGNNIGMATSYPAAGKTIQPNKLYLRMLLNNLKSMITLSVFFSNGYDVKICHVIW
ncbi:uncharacterized protein CEXT_721611 [Caerostris extrusa]|uniref:C2H2-type domain-containing protein n=1 Tax=Caerostris extrusa TaxID=172846 RepID=A0AAV4M4I3_CAEEX|nr:uncharacterized protein CEXT_721611 [Caerostris extrusa]